MVFIHMKKIFLRLILSFGLVSSFSVVAGGATFQMANLVDLPAITENGGAGTLIRTKNAVKASLSFNQLELATAYSVWWVVFNFPENCANGPGACGPDDLADPSLVGGAVFHAGGFITGTNNTATVNVDLKAGNLPNGLDALIPGGLIRGNGYRAEIHLVLRSHGTIINSMAAKQIATFMGACEINACADTQATVFAPVE